MEAPRKRPFVVIGYIKPAGTRWIGWTAAVSHADAERQFLADLPGLVVVRSILTSENVDFDDFDVVSELGAVAGDPPQ